MASLLDMLAPWLRTQTQTPDQVVSAQPQGGMNLGTDPSMLKGMPQQGSYDQQLQDPNQWNLSGQAQVPDYSRLTTPGNPAGPSYNANYTQTSYPGSTVGANPQGPMASPASRGLLMAADSAATGNAPSIAEIVKWLKQMQKQKQTGGTPPVSQLLQQWGQPTGSNPGSVMQPVLGNQQG